mmetsp:Transcript_47221/g.122037  ORF Transcript_47221/g.122037 Transcript_47221/m.122037 type:complete len:232 (-) Transcript_47221:361-1056(-)
MLAPVDEVTVEHGARRLCTARHAEGAEEQEEVPQLAVNVSEHFARRRGVVQCRLGRENLRHALHQLEHLVRSIATSLWLRAERTLATWDAQEVAQDVFALPLAVVQVLGRLHQLGSEPLRRFGHRGRYLQSFRGNLPVVEADAPRRKALRFLSLPGLALVDHLRGHIQHLLVAGDAVGVVVGAHNVDAGAALLADREAFAVLTRAHEVQLACQNLIAATLTVLGRCAHQEG